MTLVRGVRLGLLWGLASAVLTGCSPPTDTVLDCSAGDIHHLLRIRATDGQVEDLSFTPPKRGAAEISDARYVFSFPEHRDRYELVLQVDRSTGTGTRELFDDEQQAIRGHGGTDVLTCRPDAAGR